MCRSHHRSAVTTDSGDVTRDMVPCFSALGVLYFISAWGDERDVSSVVSRVVRLLWLQNCDEVGIRRVSRSPSHVMTSGDSRVQYDEYRDVRRKYF